MFKKRKPIIESIDIEVLEEEYRFVVDKAGKLFDVYYDTKVAVEKLKAHHRWWSVKQTALLQEEKLEGYYKNNS